jgi:syntaxin 5
VSHTTVPAPSGDHITIDLSSELSPPSQQQQQTTSLLPMYESNAAVLETRSQAIVDIESTIAGIETMFRQLLEVVAGQREQVQRIDANIEEFQMNIEAGQNELLKYFRSISSNRWLMVKIFAVLFVFFVLFVMVI